VKLSKNKPILLSFHAKPKEELREKAKAHSASESHVHGIPECSQLHQPPQFLFFFYNLKFIRLFTTKGTIPPNIQSNTLQNPIKEQHQKSTLATCLA